jgi:hypothetical protein
VIFRLSARQDVGFSDQASFDDGATWPTASGALVKRVVS